MGAARYLTKRAFIEPRDQPERPYYLLVCPLLIRAKTRAKQQDRNLYQLSTRQLTNKLTILSLLRASHRLWRLPLSRRQTRPYFGSVVCSSEITRNVISLLPPPPRVVITIWAVCHVRWLINSSSLSNGISSTGQPVDWTIAWIWINYFAWTWSNNTNQWPKFLSSTMLPVITILSKKYLL